MPKLNFDFFFVVRYFFVFFNIFKRYLPYLAFEKQTNINKKVNAQHLPISQSFPVYPG